MKKLISSALSAIMLAGAIGVAPVSAAATDVTKSVDFNDMTLESSATISEDFSDISYSDNNTKADSRRRYNYSTAAGMYGKEASDNSLRIYKPWVGFKNKWSTDAADVAKPSFRYYQLHYNANLTGGNYYLVSTELAVAADTTYEPTLRLYCDDTIVAYLAYDSAAKVYNVKLSADGETLATMPTTQWAKFDIAMDVTDASNQVADVYFNDTKIAEDISLKEDVAANGFGKFKLMAECSYRYASGATYPYNFDIVDVYMDNLSCSALAEDPYTNIKSEDFNDLVLDKSAVVPDGFVELMYSFDGTAASTRKIYYYSATGQYGKDADDTCLRLYNEWTNQPDSKLKQRYYQLRYLPELKGGNYYHVSTELAFKKDNNNPEILMWCDDMRICNMTYDATKHAYDLKVADEVKATVPTEKWTKFDIIMDAAAQTAKLYVNGEEVASDIALANAVTGLTQFQLGVYCNTTYDATTKKTAYYPWDVYMDNLVCAALAEEPVIEGEEEEIPADFEITAVGEAVLQENSEDLYKKGFIFTIEDMGTYNSILLEDEGVVIAGFNIADMFETIISGGAVQMGLQIYDIPEESKDLTAALSAIVLE